MHFSGNAYQSVVRCRKLSSLSLCAVNITLRTRVGGVNLTTINATACDCHPIYVAT